MPDGKKGRKEAGAGGRNGATTTLAAVKRAARLIGVGIEVECDRPQYDRWGRWQDYTITAMAPDGMAFVATGDTHTLCVQGHAQGDASQSKQTALAAMLRDLAEGVAPHVDADCEYCHPPEEAQS